MDGGDIWTWEDGEPDRNYPPIEQNLDLHRVFRAGHPGPSGYFVAGDRLDAAVDGTSSRGRLTTSCDGGAVAWSCRVRPGRPCEHPEFVAANQLDLWQRLRILGRGQVGEEAVVAVSLACVLEVGPILVGPYGSDDLAADQNLDFEALLRTGPPDPTGDLIGGDVFHEALEGQGCRTGRRISLNRCGLGRTTSHSGDPGSAWRWQLVV
jgi:hypothetical protein